MSTISQNLIRLQNAKSAIANAITQMGGTVGSGDGFEDFQSDILTIPKIQAPYIEFSGTDSFTLQVSNGKKWDGTLEYSVNLTDWQTWDGSNAISCGTNNKLYLRGIGNTKISATSQGDFSSFVFTTNGYISIAGKLNSLIDYRIATFDDTPTLANYCFDGMFDQCNNIISAKNLDINIKKITNTDCFCFMFRNCQYLTDAPIISIEDMSESSSACEYMFNNCTSLINPPELNTMSLGYSCYYAMFMGCTSLVSSPNLPATTLYSSCYQSMFQDCTSIESIASIPSLSLPQQCCYSMYDGCSKIKLSTTQTGNYQNEYRIPMSGTGSFQHYNAVTNMFYKTGGTFTGTHNINQTYYTSNEVV